MSKKKKIQTSLTRSTYDDGILTIYDKVLKTPDSYIALQNVARVFTVYYRPHFRLFYLALLILAGSIYYYTQNSPWNDSAWIYLVGGIIVAGVLTFFAFKKLHALHIDLCSGSKVTFTSYDSEFTQNVAAVIGQTMRSSDSLAAPITFNFQTTTSTLVDRSTYNQNYGINYGAMGNSTNYAYGSTGHGYAQSGYSQYGQQAQYGQYNQQYSQQTQYDQQGQNGYHG